MKTSLDKFTVQAIVDGFEYNELEGKGLFGWGGRLVIQPEYQRNYIYADGVRDAKVIQSLLQLYPLGLLYFNRTGEDSYEVLDGQQRVTSIGRFVKDQFAIVDGKGMHQYFSGLAEDLQQRILNSELLVYICEGAETEIKDWYQTVNIAGVPLNDQELWNAVYSGPFVTLGKAEFSNSLNSNVQKWSAFVRGALNRQDYWNRALDWVSSGKAKSTITDYMSAHRKDNSIDEVKNYFNNVIDWVSSTFEAIEPEMRGLEWGRLYETYHLAKYDLVQLNKRVKTLYDDGYVKAPKGIWEYVLGGEDDARLLDIRLFDGPTKRAVYKLQTASAADSGISNCALCAAGKGRNSTKVWKFDEMDADHVTAWTKGGLTSIDNCEMLCRSHNQSKGNR
jgi:hypothetical protein